MSTTSEQAVEFLELSHNWERPLQVGCKRALDVLVSGPFLILLSPLFLVLGLAVKLTSPGPVFYRWKVVGKNGRPFVGYKIRSMVANADELKANLEDRNQMMGPVFKLDCDPRITRIGFWMRRYSLDELPQLYSVLKGDMALVGPRPPLVTEYARFNQHQRLKLAVKPGMTCLWQIGGRNQLRDFDEWVGLDLSYIRCWSLWLDLRILVKTVGAVVSGSGK